MGRAVRPQGARPLRSPVRDFAPPQYSPPQLRPPRTKPRPANDNSPFRPRRPGRFGRKRPTLPGGGKRLPKLGPLGGLIAGGFAAYNYLNPPVSPKPAQWPDFDQTGWRLQYGPWPLATYKGLAKSPSPYAWLLNPLFLYEQVDPILPFTGSQTAPNTAGVGSPVQFWTNSANTSGRFYYGTTRFQYTTGELLPDRQYWHSSWVTTSPSPSVRPNPGAPFRPAVAYQPYPLGLPNPNWVRGLPGQRPGTTPHPQGYPDPAVSPAPAAPPAPAFRDARPGVPYPVPKSPIEQAANDMVGDLIGNSPPHFRRPPPRGTKENKKLSRAARIGLAGWRALDTFSELSEIGEAFWDALPKDVRKKARCRTKNQQIGQYGAAINQCQLRTIVKNWDKVDTNEAWKNLAKNLVEDMTIGEFHRWLDKFYPPGVSFRKTAATHALSQVSPEKYIAERLNELWDFLGV